MVSPRRARRRAGSVALVVLAAVACRGTPAGRGPSSSPTVPPATGSSASAPASPSLTPTAVVPSPTPSASSSVLGLLACDRSAGHVAGGVLVLRSVKAAAHPGYDRVTFEFTSVPAPAAVGGDFTMAAASSPGVQDGSGEPITEAGQAFLRVVFMDASGRDTVNTPPRAPDYAGPLDLTPGLATVVEVKHAGDFEGYLTWVIGMSHPSCWRAQVLSAPPRLVIDVPS